MPNLHVTRPPSNRRVDKSQTYGWFSNSTSSTKGKMTIKTDKRPETLRHCCALSLANASTKASIALTIRTFKNRQIRWDKERIHAEDSSS